MCLGLCAGTVGWPGSLPGNNTSANADVLLSLGCRFTDWSASSYRKGSAYSIPPGKLIHIDIDPHEIGKNYQTECGITGDIKAVLGDILAGISKQQAQRTSKARESYLDGIQGLKSQWEDILERRRSVDTIPTLSLIHISEPTRPY